MADTWIRGLDNAFLRLNTAGFFEVVGTYGEGDTFESSTVLEGFTVNVSEVFGTVGG